MILQNLIESLHAYIAHGSLFRESIMAISGCLGYQVWGIALMKFLESLVGQAVIDSDR
jgi:hypothetical protein